MYQNRAARFGTGRCHGISRDHWAVRYHNKNRPMNFPNVTQNRVRWTMDGHQNRKGKGNKKLECALAETLNVGQKQTCVIIPSPRFWMGLSLFPNGWSSVFMYKPQCNTFWVLINAVGLQANQNQERKKNKRGRREYCRS